MKWLSWKKGFASYLLMERSLSANTVEAYMDDFDKLATFLEKSYSDIQPRDITPGHLSEFVQWIYQEKRVSSR
ncbi:MAG TPA: site-specific integrase, partial [Bacteroidales bacterium]|nr:site-specific integrase [Bacteroidales bacterium]